MSDESARPGEIVDVRPLELKLAKARTTTLVKTDRFEVVRLVVHRGREIAVQQTPGELIVQCLEGEVYITVLGKSSRLRPGELVYVPAGIPHSLKSRFDSSVLVTMIFGKKE